MSRMNKALIKGICMMVCAVFACVILSGCSNIYKINEHKTILVKTKAYGNTEISFLELNNKGDYSICDEFEPNVNEYYITDGFYLNNNSIEEAFKNMGDRFYDTKLQKVPIPNGVKKALYAVDGFEGRKKHWISIERVFVCGDKYYISVSYNVNWQTPYSLLEYDEKTDSLKEIMYISNEQIIGLRVQGSLPITI